MSDENTAVESGGTAEQDAKIVNHASEPGSNGSSRINRARPRRSKAPVIAGVTMATVVVGAVFVVFARGGDGSASRMVNVPQNIDTTPAGQQLAQSENYRQALNNSNQQGSQQAASTASQSFLATPDEPTRPVAPAKDPIPVKEPTLPPPNERKVVMQEKIVYRDRVVPGVAARVVSSPTDWASIDAMAKRMTNQGNGLADAWKTGKSKLTEIIKQDLYTAPDNRPTGVRVGADSTSRGGIPQRMAEGRDRSDTFSWSDDLDRRARNGSGDNHSKSGNRSSRERRATRDPEASPVETVFRDSNFQADSGRSPPYPPAGPRQSEPRLQVSVGQRYGSDAQLFADDYFATAGSVTYAVIVNGSDTDTPGPVVAKIMRGPLKNARLIGSFKENKETTAMVVQFDRVVLPDGTDMDASAYAVDPAKGTLAVKSEYDARLLQRYGPRLAGAFLSGIGRTLSQTETTIVGIGDAGVGISRPKPQIEQGLYAAAGDVGDQIANEIEDMGPDGPIVRLNAGKLIGVLFTESIRRF